MFNDSLMCFYLIFAENKNQSIDLLIWPREAFTRLDLYACESLPKLNFSKYTRGLIKALGRPSGELIKLNIVSGESPEPKT